MTLRDLKAVWSYDTKVSITALAYERESMDYFAFRTCVDRERFYNIEDDDLLELKVKGIGYHDGCLWVDVIEYVDTEEIY